MSPMDGAAGQATGGAAPTDRRRLEATVRGVVQGVGFRFFVIRRASELELDGWIANRPDGGVECVAEGPAAHLDALLAALSEGPPGALVSDVEARWLLPSGTFTGFGVRSLGHSGD